VGKLIYQELNDSDGGSSGNSSGNSTDAVGSGDSGDFARYL
jgi:hypothetical protein